MAAPSIRNNSGIGAAGTPATQTLPQPVIGNYIVCFNFSFAAVSTGYSDTAGNTYTHKLNAVDANGNNVDIFTAPVTATGSGTDTITSSNGGAICAIEVTGNASSTPDDGTGTGTFSGSSGGTLTASAINTTVANDLILSAAIDQNTATLTVNTGILVTSGSSRDFNIVQQHTVSSTGGYAEAFNVPVSASETAAIAAIAIKGTASAATSIAWTKA